LLNESSEAKIDTRDINNECDILNLFVVADSPPPPNAAAANSANVTQ